MYRRPKFLEVLLDIRREMAREADYDADLFVEMARSGISSPGRKKFDLDEQDRPPKGAVKKTNQKAVRKERRNERA